MRAVLFPAARGTSKLLTSIGRTTPQAYLTQLLANLPDTPVSRIDDWLPDRWKEAAASPSPASSPTQT